ncbi:hypothetical protein P9112_007247 [Eukaryota sp. TZLM1-RC]
MALIRNDGRNPLDFRPFHYSFNVLPVSMGSCRLCLGNTEILASVKGEIGSPTTGYQSGSLHVNVNFDQAYAGRNIMYKQRERDLESLITSSYCGTNSDSFFSSLHSTSLIIDESTVWDLYIDICVLSIDGSLEDGCFLASRFALQNTKLPVVHLSSLNTPVLSQGSPPMTLDCSSIPLSCTLYHYQNVFIADPLEEELDEVMGSVVCVGVEKGGLSMIQKRGSSSFGVDSFCDLVVLGTRVITDLFNTCNDSMSS